MHVPAQSGTNGHGVEALWDVGWIVARGINRLTALQIAKAARKGLTLCDGGGLYLQRGRAWIFRYSRGGRAHWLGLGPLELVDLPAAREAALANRKLLFAGVDPLASRRGQRATTMLFDDCVRGYLDAHRDGWKNPKHRQQWQSTLTTYASPVIGALPVRSIDTALAHFSHTTE